MAKEGRGDLGGEDDKGKGNRQTNVRARKGGIERDKYGSRRRGSRKCARRGKESGRKHK